MDNSKEPNFRRLVIIAGLFILLSVVLLFWARDVIREVVVLPLSYLIYVTGILIDYTPQIFFWIVLLIIGLRIAYLSISRKKQKDEEDLRAFFKLLPDGGTPASGRVAFWMSKVYLARSGQAVYYTRTFHDALGRTLFQLLAYRYRLSTRQVEESLRDGSLFLPPEIQEYALKSLDPIEGPEGGYLREIWDSILTNLRMQFLKMKDAFRSIAGDATSFAPLVKSTELDGLSDSAKQRNKPRSSPDDMRVRRVLKFMEEELEVPHDDAGR